MNPTENPAVIPEVQAPLPVISEAPAGEVSAETAQQDIAQLETAEQDTTEIIAVDPDTPDLLTSPAFLGGVGVAVVVIIAAIILMIRKKAARSAGKSPADTSPAQNTTIPSTAPTGDEPSSFHDAVEDAPPTVVKLSGAPVKLNGVSGKPAPAAAEPARIAVTEDVNGSDYTPSRYSAGYAQILGARENQEDSYCITNWVNAAVVSEKGILAAVADGIGGMNNGQVASGTVVRNLCARFDNQNPAAPLSSRLLDLAAGAQRDVMDVIRQVGRCGSTLVSVLIQNGQMALLSIGDSRVALYRSGILLQLNREHVLGKENDEAAALSANPGPINNQKRQAITAYLGKENLRQVDRTINPIQLVAGDRVLLMSDGIFGTLSDDEIIATLKLPPDQAAQAIARAVEAKQAPHQDNATVVIIGMN